MPTGLDLGVIVSFVMDNWLIVAIVAIIAIQVVKKLMRLTKRALTIMYSLSGGFAGLGFVMDIVEKLFEK